MTFRRDDYVQAVQAAIAAGLKVHRTEIHEDGRIVIHHQRDDLAEEEVDIPAQTIARAEPADPADEPKPLPKVFTPKTLGAFWGCSEATVRNMIRRGSLPSFSLGGKLVRIRTEDVLAYEERQQVTKARQG